MPEGGNAFLFKPAVRENTPMVIALAGASGSGKTFTALELATGMAGQDGRVAVIDTEGRRALHYADLRNQKTDDVLFRFDHCELRPPFSPGRFLAAMKAAESAGYRVIVVDSFSDEHEGEGGLIDMAAAGTNQNSAANWARPKAQHKLIVRWLHQVRCHVIFCLRAEERVRIEKIYDENKGREVTAVVPIGWWPIAEKRFMYDMTASFLLSPDKPGIPQPIKLQEQHQRFFPTGLPVTRDSGRLLAAWAMGGAAGPPPQRTLEDALRLQAEGAATDGTEAFREWWRTLGHDERATLKPDLPEYQRVAQDADARHASDRDPDDPFGLPPSPPAAAAERPDADVQVPVTHQGAPFSERFAALAPADSGNGLDWGSYTIAAIELMRTASKEQLAAYPFSRNPHLLELRRTDGDLYRRIMDAVREAA